MRTAILLPQQATIFRRYPPRGDGLDDAHTVSNKVEAAYHRTDLIEQRRPMMEAWAKFVCNQ